MLIVFCYRKDRTTLEVVGIKWAHYKYNIVHVYILFHLLLAVLDVDAGPPRPL